MSATDQTFVVELTPAGRAAVASVLVAGPNALGAVDNCFVPASGQRVSAAPIDRVLVGRWGSPEGEELVVCRRAEQVAEVHCHGGPAAVGMIVDRLASLGCTHSTWQNWLNQTQRDPIRLAARIALADALTERAAAILLDQHQGALDPAIREALAAVSAADWRHAMHVVDGLLRFRDVGLHLTRPWRVVLAGRPNVGKSSLFNAIAGYQRAIISPQPGTTRDVVTTLTAVEGWPVELADTAGLRDTKDSLESAGVDLAAAAQANADLVVMVHVAGQRQTARMMGGTAKRHSTPVLSVYNKIDLVGTAGQHAAVANDTLWTSALTGEGIRALLSRIASMLVPIAPRPGAAVPFTVGQIGALEAAHAAIGVQNFNESNTALGTLLMRH